MRDIIEISPHVLTWAANCPEPVMVHFLREAAITFCKRSRSWRSEEVYAVNSADEDIQLVTCCDSAVFEIASVRWRGNDNSEWQRNMEPASFSDRDDWWREGNPRFYTQRLPNTLRVAPFTTGQLSVLMYLKPDNQADTLPDYLVETYPQIIAAGALGKIMMLPGYDFSDINLAMFHQQQFDKYCDEHFRDNLRGQQGARPRTKANYF